MPTRTRHLDFQALILNAINANYLVSKNWKQFRIIKLNYQNIKRFALIAILISLHDHNGYVVTNLMENTTIVTHMMAFSTALIIPHKRKNRPGYTEAAIDLCLNWLRGPDRTETCKIWPLKPLHQVSMIGTA